MARVAVVTGAGRGFGEAIARRLAGEGYDVLCTDIDEAAAHATAEAIGGGAWAMRLDVRDPKAHRDAARAASERGPLELWVNNAGVLRTDKAWEHPDADLALMVQVNLMGVIYGSRAALEAMRERGGAGDIVNIGSTSSFCPVPGLGVYGATKHGVRAFSESLQGDLRQADVPVRVHVLNPDSGDTEMVRERTEEEASIIFSAPRMIERDEVAEAVVGLVGSDRLVTTLPRWRGGMLRAFGLAPRGLLRLVPLFVWMGERQRARR